MPIVTTIIGLIPVVLQIEGGIESLFNLITTLHKGGALSDADVATIRSDGDLADADFDAQLAAAKQRQLL